MFKDSKQQHLWMKVLHCQGRPKSNSDLQFAHRRWQASPHVFPRMSAIRTSSGLDPAVAACNLPMVAERLMRSPDSAFAINEACPAPILSNASAAAMRTRKLELSN